MSETELNKELSNLIFVYRKMKNITLEKLSELSGVDGRFIGMMERGKHSTLVSNYLKLAKALDIPVEEIAKIIRRYYAQ